MNNTITVIGILGGGQLGRMFIQEAINLNVDVHILDPDANAPCKEISSRFQQGSLLDYDTVLAFGQACDVITIEIETVNTEALKALRTQGKKVFPQPEVIELIQDKRLQKQFYKENGIPTSEFILTDNMEEVIANKHFLPAVNKMGRGGYDGRGVQILRSEEDLPKAFDAKGLLEKFIPFEKELAVIVSRNEKGEMATFPVVDCEFHPEANLVEFLFAPADISEDITKKAQKIAKSVIQKLDMVGLLAVELFLTKEGDILVNEVAPRPHNSGHHTIEGNMTSQFAHHLRSILNLAPGDTTQRSPAAMINLLGEDGYTGDAVYAGLKEALSESGVYVHLYGKKLTKPFRKMGHVTVIDSDLTKLKAKARKIKETIKVIA